MCCSLRSFALPLLALAFAGCVVPAENPCDPDAEEGVQETGTLRGVVVDAAGDPVAGVTVAIADLGQTTATVEDGSFVFEELPPNDPQAGYELVALPAEPALGGRVTAEPLACRAEVGGLVLHVIDPPPAPEVELVKATAPDRLFVAFASAGADASYTVQVRAPFEPWTDAVLVEDSLRASTSEGPLYASDEEIVRSKSDADAQSACAGFVYAEPSLQNDNARCAEVGAQWVDGQLEPLVPYGSYQVRVRAETPVGEDLQLEQLPEVVRSLDTTVPGRMSLVPTAVLPVMMGTDATTQAERMAEMDVHAIVPTGQGRFAMVDGDAMSVIGLGDVLDSSYSEVDGAPADAMVLDDYASQEATSEVAADDGRPLAILPAGRWVRVWKEKTNDLGTTSSQVEKVFVGAAERDETAAPAGVEPGFDLEVIDLLPDDFRGFDWLWIPSGSVREPTYNPPDAYMLLFRQGIVLLERERLADGVPAVLTSAFEDDLGDDGLLNGEWALDADGQLSGVNGTLCGTLGDGAEGSAGSLGDRTTRVCYDLEDGLSESLDLVASTILPSTAGETARDTTYNLLVDRAGDRVLATRTDRFLGEVAGRLVDAIQPVRVGVRPQAVAVSELLDCTDESGDPVALVANAGSLDISVLEASASGVAEITSLGLPGVPTGFLRDPAGVSCADPFVWVKADDGRVFPLDMRGDRFGFPLCGDEPCVVDTRGRADAGGVSRGEAGTARVLIGGRGMLGELGYLRPSR